jgi:hypothetical protein
MNPSLRGRQQQKSIAMSKLRDLVIDAHGGLARWKSVQTIEGDMSITGGMWAMKGWPDALKTVNVTARTQSQWISYRPFVNDEWRSVCTPEHTVIETTSGQAVKERRNPREAFRDHVRETKWDELNLAYFSGYAMWNYLNAPFIFSLDGVDAEEIARREDNGQHRRRLKVTFPDSIATHCSEQIFHIDGDGLIRRLDYSAQVLSGIPTAHYLSDYRDFGGLKIATKRRAHRRNPDGTAVPEAIAVAIDIADIRLA